MPHVRVRHYVAARRYWRGSRKIEAHYWQVSTFVRLAYITCSVFIVLASSIMLLSSTKKAAAGAPCPCHIFGTPSGQSTYNDASPYELGTRFYSQLNGYITGIRFYKALNATGTHTVHLWNADGQLLAEATPASETASGWQDVPFTNPVAISANTMYTVSYSVPSSGLYVATSSFFSTDTSNYPLVAPQSGTYPDTLGNGGNGTYITTPGQYPTSSSNSNNYWVDADFSMFVDGSAPAVSSTTPGNTATNVDPTANVSVTFNRAMDPGTLTNTNFYVEDQNGTQYPGTVAYDSSTYTATLSFNTALQPNAKYTALLVGGPGGVTDIDGTPLDANYSWSFQTANYQCPCSLWDEGKLPATPQVQSNGGGLELGQKFVSSISGYVVALRFYKSPLSALSSHTGHLWDSSGKQLATVTFTNESDYGWQEALLSQPVAITAGNVYTVSYYDSDGQYVGITGYYNGNSYGHDGIHVYASGSSLMTDSGGTGSGSYLSGSDAFPTTQTDNAYGIDVVIALSASTHPALSVVTSTPSPNVNAAFVNTPITVNFNHALNAATVNTTTVSLINTSTNSAVSGTATYNLAYHQIEFTPSVALAYDTPYELHISSSLSDVTNLPLSGGYVLPFKTGAPLQTNPATGMGGPILVVADTSIPYSTYNAEMLRTEGINYFDVATAATALNTSTLNQYKIVVLGPVTLTANQVSTLTQWVNNGGVLVAEHPDHQLASLLGLAYQGAQLSNSYMGIDTSTAEGSGLTSVPLQYHGAADEYAVNGANVLATLYDNPTTSTSWPAVTWRQSGAGYAAAFTYNLPQSIALTHQGNPAWAGQARDGLAVLRADDLFYGNMSTDPQPDWINLNNAYIPQADEQQRLLVNVMSDLSTKTLPMPRFWYFPGNYKAAVVMASDDHGTNGGTATSFSNLVSNDNPTCSVDLWQCERATSMVYPTQGPSPAQVKEFEGAGFEVGVHPEIGVSDPTGTACNIVNWTGTSDLYTYLSNSINTFNTYYPGTPPQKTDRLHCYQWSDWDSLPIVDTKFGIRYDMTYDYYPPSWVVRPGFLSGSGMVMRFTDSSGNLIDTYQGVTDIDYETFTSTNADALSIMLGYALGSSGYYGFIGTHYDYSNNYDQELAAVARSNSVPMISGAQLVDWKDGRGSSNFSGLSFSNSQLHFSITAGEGANDLTALVPLSAGSASLQRLYLSCTPVTYSSETIKGIAYASFSGLQGNYTAEYGTATLPSGCSTNGPTSSLLPTSQARAAAQLTSTTNDSLSPQPSQTQQKPQIAPNPNTYIQPTVKQHTSNMVTIFIAVGSSLALCSAILVIWKLRALISSI